MSETMYPWLVPLILFACWIGLFLLPGIVARIVYFQFPFSEEARSRDAIPALFWTLVTGTCMEVAWIWIHQRLTGRWMSSAELAFLLTGTYEDEVSGLMIQHMIDQRLQWIFFVIVPLVAAAVLGWLARQLVIWTRADIHIPLLRYSNHWYYILSGRMQEQGGRLVALPSDVNFVRVEVLTREGSSHVIYSGQLISFQLLSGDRLHSIQIRHPYKSFPERPLAATTSPESTHGFEPTEAYEMEFLYDDVIDLKPFYYTLKAGQRQPSPLA